MTPSLELQVGDRGNDRSITCIHDAPVPRVRPRSCPGSDGASLPVVAATKLTIPRSRRPLVPRPGLSARLDEDYRLALVSAPAGYGKTAALAMWAAGHRDRVAWLSCDPADAEPTRFMAGLLAALAARWPGVADDAYVLLERDGADIYDAAAAVANELATIGSPGVIVVDDLHLAAPDPALLDRVHRGVARRLPFRRRYPVRSANVAGPAAPARRPARAACRRSQLLPG